MSVADAPSSAIEVVRRAPNRQSLRARSTNDRVIYVIGDIHGCYLLFTALLDAIVTDAGLHLGEVPPLLVLCGDYVDRGPRSSDVLAALVWLARNAALEIAILRGNHEAMLLGFLEQPEKHLLWLRRGGSTLRSYGVVVSEILEGVTGSDCRRLRDELLDRMPASHLDLLQELAIKKICGDYVFVHAGLRPRVSLAKQTEEDCLWIGEEFLESDYRFEKVVVHGHSWFSDAPVITSHRLGIDTGAYATGVLTAARLEGADVEIIQARVKSCLLPAIDGMRGL